MRLRKALIGFVVLFAVTAGAALAADPTDTTFGTKGIAEIEARAAPREDVGQVGGIVDLQPTRSGKMLAAVDSIAVGGHFFAAARIDPDGALDRGFGKDGFTPYINASHRRDGDAEGALQAEAVAGLTDGKVLVAGYYEDIGVFAPALALFTAKGSLDRSFGHDGKVIPRPSYDDKPISTEGGGERLRDVAVEPDGTIVVCVPTFPEGGEEPIVFERLLPDGRRDTSFGKSIYMEPAPIDSKETGRRHGPAVQSFTFSPLAIAIDGHGRALVTGGETAPYNRGQKEPGHEDFTSRRFPPDGRRDRSFGEGGVWHTDPPGSESLARAALTQPDGQVVAGGWIQIERGGGNGPGNTAMLLTRYR